MNDRRKSANDFQKQNQAKRLKNTYISGPFSPFQLLKPACFLAFEVERLIIAKMLQTDRKRPFSQISIIYPEVRVFFIIKQLHASKAGPGKRLATAKHHENKLDASKSGSRKAPRDRKYHENKLDAS